MQTAETLRALDSQQEELEAATPAAAAAAAAGSPPCASASPTALPARLLGWLAAGWAALRRGLAHLEAQALGGTKAALESAPSGSWLWWLAQVAALGPFRGAILRFYSRASDHTRRLTSIKANAKFSTAQAGPEHPLNVRGAGCFGCCDSLPCFPGVLAAKR